MANLKKVNKSADTGAEEALNEDTLEEVQQSIDKGITLADDEDACPEFELLCGYKDADGVMHKTFTVREMTGRDEEAISKPEIKQNTSKVIGVLLSRCVLTLGTLEKKDYSPQEWHKIMLSLYTGDQDYIVMQIRKISIGETIEVQHTCPNCGAKLNTELAIDELEVTPFSGNDSIPFTLSKGYKDRKGVVHTDGTIRLANGLDREILTPLAKKNLARANTVLLTRLCKFADGTLVDEDAMASLTSKDREYLNTLLQENTFGYDLRVSVDCTECGESFDGSLNMVNFLK